MKWVLLAYVIVCSIVSDIAMKNATGLNTYYFAFGATLYLASAFGWLYIFRSASMSWIAVTYSTLTILLLTTVGVVGYKEPLTTRKIVGVLAAVAAIALAE